MIVATPGRLADCMERLGTVFNCKELEVLVMDEADRYGGFESFPVEFPTVYASLLPPDSLRWDSVLPSTRF